MMQQTAPIDRFQATANVAAQNGSLGGFGVSRVMPTTQVAPPIPLPELVKERGTNQPAATAQNPNEPAFDPMSARIVQFEGTGDNRSAACTIL